MIRVDTSLRVGKIRRLHGTNLAAPMARGEQVVRDLKDLGIPLARLHDAPLENPGMRLVDVSMVFPRFDADPQDPANYFFAQTDDYIANCLACADQVSYRLGESIEHTPKQYFVVPPKNHKKWAEICINIIRHYNEGWADGFHYNLDYWHIWEEPDNIPKLWAGTWDEFIQLYVTAARKIKARFPHLKVGGCAMRDAVGWEDPAAPARLTQFLTACREQQAPLDFFTWTCYTDSLARILREPAMLRGVFNSHGFTQTELHLAEWHYIPDVLWGDLFGTPERRKRAWDAVNGLDSAAFIAATLTGLQDTPIAMANYYAGSTLRWGFYDLHGARNKCYYAFEAFSLLASHANRVTAILPAGESGMWALAGRDTSDGIALLLSCLNGPAGQIDITFDGAGIDARKARVLAIDAQRNLEPLEILRESSSTLTFSKPAGPAIFFIEAP